MPYFKDRPFMIWSRGKKGEGPSCSCCRTWGVVKPLHLSFATQEEGEEIAVRYRKTYPSQDFICSTEKPQE